MSEIDNECRHDATLPERIAFVAVCSCAPWCAILLVLVITSLQAVGERTWAQMVIGVFTDLFSRGRVFTYWGIMNLVLVSVMMSAARRGVLLGVLIANFVGLGGIALIDRGSVSDALLISFIMGGANMFGVLYIMYKVENMFECNLVKKGQVPVVLQIWR